MDFEDEDLFMDIDANILSGVKDRNKVEKDKENFLDRIIFGADAGAKDKKLGEKIAKRQRGFECLGKNISKKLEVDENSLIGFAIDIINSSNYLLKDDNGNKHITLFNFTFEKSTALSNCTYELFNFAFSNIYDLEELLVSQNKSSDCTKLNKNLLQFFQYILQYLERYSNEKLDFQERAANIWNNFHQLKLCLKPLKSIGSAMIANQSLCHQQLHVYLNVHLYYLMTTYRLLSIQNVQSDFPQCTQYTSEISDNNEAFNFNFNTLKNDILLVMIQLTELTLKSFNKMNQLEDAYHLSPFKCDCIMEFWFVLRLLCKKIDGNNKNELFWKNLENVFELIEKSSDQKYKDVTDLVDNYEKLPPYITCSKPYLYMIWFLKHLLSLDLNTSESTESGDIGKFNDDCESTEKLVKKLTNIDTISENELRIILTFLDSIMYQKESCKPDIITSLWEYFHKRLNSNFILKSMPFAYSMSSLSCNRNVLEIVTHIEHLISPSIKQSKGEENSYTLFLRILGMYLLKYNHEQRVWNQIKGRMYSKFSQNKLSTLSEQGIQHLSHLFILLFFVKGNQELTKIQTFLNIILSIKDKDGNAQTTREIILKTNLAFILISIHNHSSIDASLISSVMTIINQNHPSSSNYESVLKIYLQTVKDVLSENEDITLGQDQLLGPWVEKVLTSKLSSNVMNIFYSLFTLVLNKLRPYHPIEKDSQIASYFTCAMQYVLPNLQIDANFNPDTLGGMTKFLSALTLFSISGGVNYKSEATLILNRLIVMANVSFVLKMNYVKCLLSCEDMQNFSLVAFIPNIETVVTQCYLLSLILSEQSDGDGMKRYVDAHCLRKLKQRYALESSQCTQEQVVHSSNDETLKQFLRDLNLINSSITDIESRNHFHSEVQTLFSFEETLKHVINMQDKSNTSSAKITITSIFTSVAIIIDHIGHILYKKSKPNSQLQCFLDTLLLQFQVRSAEYKLCSSTTHALRLSFHMYINGLMKLDPGNDMYIARVLRELLQLYLPRLVNKIPYETPFGFVKCFNESASQDSYLWNLLTSLFLRKKCKVSDKNTHEYLVFVQEVLNHNSDVQFLSRFIQSSLELLLNNLISLTDIDVCKNKIRAVLIKCFANPALQVDPCVRNHVMVVLTKMTNENLAFSFGGLFQLLHFLLESCCPGLVTDFRRTVLVQKIKTVEMKRGVEEDKILRNHLDQLDRSIKKVLLVKS